MNLVFVGNTKSPFIQQDLKLLKEDYQVTVFEVAGYSLSVGDIFFYLIRIVSELKHIRESDTLWLWFADYPAVPFIVLAKMLGKPSVVNVGGWEVFADKEAGYGNQLSAVRGAISIWVIRNATVCITMSDAYRKLIREVEPQANVVVQHGWINEELSNKPLPEKSGTLTAYCTYPNSRTIKGIQTFNQATAGMDATVLNDTPHGLLIERMLHAKVYCQLSLTESFGMSVLEAMACGCVPVVSDRGALPELIGDTGVIVPYGNVEATREAIKQAMTMSGELARERSKRFQKWRKKSSINALLWKILGDNQ